MSLRSYGLLKATILDRALATTRSDHYMLLCRAGNDRWRAAINAHSDEPPGEVEYAVVKPFTNPLRTHLSGLAEGWHGLRPGDGLDYVRGGLCPPSQFKPLPLAKAGAANDLNELFDLHLARGAHVYIYGVSWGPDRDPDQYFHFPHSRGVHDIHQNQGNVAEYARDDGVWQDGGVLVERAGAWTAVFLRFQSQSWRTDNATGHAR